YSLESTGGTTRNSRKDYLLEAEWNVVTMRQLRCSVPRCPPEAFLMGFMEENIDRIEILGETSEN
ncbi:MAG: hypothetical protein LBQ54_12480, partial [Planctomycetaceae bacterium]|nr:hypothetical protein [Planctomycetaceae bacterium]